MRYVRSRNAVMPIIGLGAARIEMPLAWDDRRLGSIPGPRSTLAGPRAVTHTAFQLVEKAANVRWPRFHTHGQPPRGSK